jgi:tetratricopeptide (TPR) repeat protein
LAVAEEYVQRFPEARESHYWLGQTLLELQRYEDARHSHRQAIQIDPKLIPAYYSLALACTRLGRLDEAAQYRQQFAVLKESDLELERGRNRQYRDLAAQRDIVSGTHMAAGDVHLRFGDLRKAEAHWLRGAAINPQHTPCREALVVLYERQGRKESALNVVQQLTAIEPHIVGHWVQAGNLHAQLGQDQPARHAFRRAIQCDADAVEAYLGLVELDLRAGQMSPETVRMARKAVDLQPSVRSHLLLGAVLQENGDRAGAVAAAENALALDPDNPELRQAYAALKQGK